MPTPREGETEAAYVERCIPIVISEGTAQDGSQGAAVCHSMYRRHHQRNEQGQAFSASGIDVNGYSVRTETHQGKRHIVVPAVMLVEGVHSGSHGPLLHLAEEMNKFPAAWDGIPVCVRHPTRGGTYVPANSPDVIDSEAVGRVYNTHFEGGKLKAELWLDEELLRARSPLALGYILQGRPLEISTGAFSEEHQATGQWNGESYTAIARNYHPDHLALLPGGRGACSWQDGCGVRINEEGGGIVNHEDALAVKKFTLDGKGILLVQLSADQGFRSTMQAIQAKLDRMDDDTKLHFLTEVFDAEFIYEVKPRTEGGLGANGVMYRRSYQVKGDGSIEFTGEPNEVRREVNYVNVNIQANSQEGGTETMVEKKKCCADKVNMLIANCKSGKFTEADRTWLSDLEDANIDKLLAMQEIINKPAEEPAKTEGITKEQAIAVLQEQFKDTEQALKLFSPAIAEQLRAGLKANKDQRDKMVAHIVANDADKLYTKEELEGMSFEALTKLYQYKPAPADYSLHGGAGEGTDAGKKKGTLLPPLAKAKTAATA
jgi:hypothetical protein